MFSEERSEAVQAAVVLKGPQIIKSTSNSVPKPSVCVF